MTYILGVRACLALGKCRATARGASCPCTMPSKQPQLGSLAIQAPSLTPKTVHVTPSTCHDISVFKGGFYQRCWPRGTSS